jgi:hypothetical protein
MGIRNDVVSTTKFMDKIEIDPNELGNWRTNTIALFRVLANMKSNKTDRLKFDQALSNLFCELVQQAIMTSTILQDDSWKGLINLSDFSFPNDCNYDEEITLIIEDRVLTNTRGGFYEMILSEITGHMIGTFGAAKIAPLGAEIATEMENGPAIALKIFSLSNIAQTLKELIKLTANYSPELYRSAIDYFTHAPFKSIYHYSTVIREGIESWAFFEQAHENEFETEKWSELNDNFHFLFRWTYTDPILYEKIKKCFREGRSDLVDISQIVELSIKGLPIAIKVFQKMHFKNIHEDKIIYAFAKIITRLTQIYGKENLYRALGTYFKVPDANEFTINQKLRNIARQAHQLQENGINILSLYETEG